jgi:hypothetical protein
MNDQEKTAQNKDSTESVQLNAQDTAEVMPSIVDPIPNTAVVIPPAQAVQENVREIAYVIPDKGFGKFEVLRGKSGTWWNERGKVENLITGFKNGYNIKQSCIYAGISIDQWDYFVELHPDFYRVKEICENIGDMLIESGIVSHLKKETASVLMWAAERRNPSKWGKQDPLPPVNPMIGTVIQNNNYMVDSSVFSPEVLASIDAEEKQDGNPEK